MYTIGEKDGFQQIENATNAAVWMIGSHLYSFNIIVQQFLISYFNQKERQAKLVNPLSR